MAKNKLVEATVADLTPDDKNFNKGTKNGGALVRKSIEKFKAGRSILLDKNNRIIAGNKTVENYSGTGGQKILIVESDGDTLIAVKRTDLDLDSVEGREMALADNAAAKANIAFDVELVEAELGEILAEEWEVIKPQKEVDNPEGTVDMEIYLNVRCSSEKDAEQLYNELSKKGYECKIIS